MLSWHRERHEWRDLRDRLHQWLDVAADDPRRVGRLLEIAEISTNYLDDPEAALAAHGDVLAIDETNEPAQQGMAQLMSAIDDSKVHRQWLRMQTDRETDNARRIDLQLQIADLEEKQLKDVGGAIRTLRKLFDDEDGDLAVTRAFDPLRRLLIENERYDELIEVLGIRVDQLSERDQKLPLLNEALSIADQHIGDGHAQLKETLYRKILDLDPNSAGVRARLARQLRSDGRFQELVALLNDGQPDILAQYEIARVLLRNLDRPAEAKAVYERLSNDDPAAEGAVLARAMLARSAGDIEAYIDLREQQAQQIEPQEASMVLCHLAEVCEEADGYQGQGRYEERIVDFYRRARELDSTNVPAREALKGIGRRLKSLRPQAALLPLDGERELDEQDRACRLKALGDGTIQNDVSAALGWYRRAVSVDPNNPDLWAALAAAHRLSHDAKAAYRARTQWLHALQRQKPLAPDMLKLEARRLYELAVGAKEAKFDEQYERLVRRAFELVPEFAPAALACSQQLIDQGDFKQAFSMLHSIIESSADDLNQQQLATALHGRGRAYQHQQNYDAALSDYRRALRLAPLHRDCLISTASLLAESSRHEAAVEHQIRALMVAEPSEHRGQLYAELGSIWDDHLQRPSEAGACYELALAEGNEHRNLLHRALLHYQRTEQMENGLHVVSKLIPSADTPDELARLWLARGNILASRGDQDDKAIEAFDMALSYEPNTQAAREGLIVVLERRGDWSQLLQVLEASCDVGPPEQRAIALHKMADMSEHKLGNPSQAIEYLRRSVDAFPTLDALTKLDEVYKNDPASQPHRRKTLGHLIGFGPPWFDRVIELGKVLLAEDEISWAWCILSPLLGVSQVEADLKTTLQSMRKERERPPIRVAPTSATWQPSSSDALQGALGDLARDQNTVGRTTLEAAGITDAIAVGANTRLGKTFNAIAEAVGLPQCQLLRTTDPPESVTVINHTEGPKIVVRTDVMQQLVHAEVGFLFAYSLYLAQPHNIVLASLPAKDRSDLINAIGHLSGHALATGPASDLAPVLRNQLGAETVQRWVDRSRTISWTSNLASDYWDSVRSSARRSGMLAGADLRQVFRVLARLEPTVPRPRVVARLSELDEYVTQSDMLRDIVVFAASPQFGELLSQSRTLKVD